MTEIVDQLVSRYERGRISRRELAASLVALVSARVAAQPQSAPVAVRTLNHASINVSDVDRTVDFYQRHFGMRVISREGTAANPIAGGAGVVVNLAPGPGPEFIGIYKVANEKPSINHFCLGVQNFNSDQELKTLTDQGVTARMRTRGESKEIFVVDPDGISVQLTDASYCGGTGPLGNRCTP
jgi:catechol 2,3-dioxygenase-like lactoylglutathione lyase family enzyme